MIGSVLKFFSPLAQPIALIWVILIIETIFLLAKKRWKLAIVPGIIAIIIFVIGSTALPDYLIASLEKGYTREPPTAVGRADVVVVLGGGTWPSRHNVFGFDFKDASDRLITGTELMRQGKAEAFVAGCGFWRDGGRRLSQSPLIRQWIDAWHLFDAPVYNLGTSLDTYEEGRAFEKLADQHGWEEVILVTSAIHMRRAEAVFEKIGFDVECVATDFVSLDVPPSRRPNNPFPTLNGFEKVELYLHEKLGWIAYRLRGRI